MCRDNLKLDKKLSILPSNKRRVVESGIGLGMIGGIIGGTIGLLGIIFVGNASFNDMWKGCVAGVLAGAAIGAAMPSL